MQKESVKITKLAKCDFKPMFEHFEREKEKKKAMTKEEKKQCVVFTLSVLWVWKEIFRLTD